MTTVVRAAAMHFLHPGNVSVHKRCSSYLLSQSVHAYARLSK